MKKILYILIALAVVGGIVWLIKTPGRPGIYDDFAKCIKQANATFWGAFWCPHCKNQKARFGKSAQYLPYKECSNPDGQTQTQECTTAGITTYPTWDFPTTTTPQGITMPAIRRVGELELVDLAQQTGCMLPE
jgi:hypothetical protein